MLELLYTDERMNIMNTSHPITDKRGKVVHFSALCFKPLCKPGTKVGYHAALIGANGSRLCETCAERDLQARYNAAVAAENEV